MAAALRSLAKRDTDISSLDAIQSAPSDREMFCCILLQYDRNMLDLGLNIYKSNYIYIYCVVVIIVVIIIVIIIVIYIYIIYYILLLL